jgi:hypothetical protein
MGLIFWLSYFSGMSFLGFGLSCFLNPFIKKEFERYGLSKYRTTTGLFQLIGAFAILLTDYNLTVMEHKLSGFIRTHVPRFCSSNSIKR